MSFEGNIFSRRNISAFLNLSKTQSSRIRSYYRRSRSHTCNCNNYIIGNCCCVNNQRAFTIIPQIVIINSSFNSSDCYCNLIGERIRSVFAECCRDFSTSICTFFRTIIFTQINCISQFIGDFPFRCAMTCTTIIPNRI